MLFSFLSSAWSSSFCLFSAGDSSCSCGTSPALGWRWPTGASREGAPCAKALLQPDAVTTIRADATTANRMTAHSLFRPTPHQRDKSAKSLHESRSVLASRGRQGMMQMVGHLIYPIDFSELL